MQWRHDLIDQCIRRLLVALRDWTPIIATSRNGTRVLVAIAELRKDLVELEATWATTAQVSEPLVVSLRARARLLAYFLELKSGADPHAAGGAGLLRPAPGDPGVAGVGGRPVGPGPVRRGVDQGPGGGDPGAQPGELSSAAPSVRQELGEQGADARERQSAAERPGPPRRRVAERGPGLRQARSEVLLRGHVAATG